MNDTLGIALIGCGTVGGGVARVLLAHADRVTQRAGRPLELRRVVVRDPSKSRDPLIPLDIISTDIHAAINDPGVHVVVELIGGTGLAKRVVLDALAAGKHVVTANKALLADAGAEVFEAARRADRTVCFEAAVAGGVPVIRALGESLAANQVTAIQAILNGTSNFILTAMAEGGKSYADALAEAQKLGYAEADPTLDVDGSDAAHKLAILAQIAFGVAAKPHEIARQGIDTIEAIDIRFANELGYTIKLLAEAWTGGHSHSGNGAKLSRSGAVPAEPTVALHVAPVLLRHTDLLAQVRGAYNAVLVYGDVVGETLYQGPGAGQMPTASSVVADLIDLGVGRAQRTFAAAKLWSREDRGFTVEPPERVRSRFYLRLQVVDRPGVLADVTRILADEEISISSLVQHEAEEEGGGPVPLVVVTHYASTGRFRKALDRITRLPTTAAAPVFFSMGD
ncbi:Homoserine dehydrogenase [Gemmata obscuriglobus]|uniref:Homoserine dehydrogenase n=1 Tax=Gemmata obscuriglobus TaxID=114 RepID=A0A2Z3HBM4_9BACT|nr:homoserine dehydrogenase [Gemmata obscuriglobus]AWM41792.1 homoserine dehydrogenase [Gemmata obscuriglobus]QEG32247.1 Homoserine dehydrogenase [Gemmata obscuriglobus]VTS11603.1 homoserine dehydrogenase : Homoserine dehydrogenase OS=Planctomyces limnophilus (strain ATCC 43296 / DSM 3776 / IFAM 1008 / 290) GN=Plim_2809 PE=3 SV=1: NAD_binding_3: Homoserine_dh: ACT [Gemmata obscuriglobus UQM 2246]